MKKGIIIVVAIILALSIGIFLLINAIAPETYSSARDECESFLEDNRGDIEQIASDLLNKQMDIYGHYKERYYSYVPREDYVIFDIDAQGMLGGQYWSLIYTRNGVLYGETEEYLYQETDGNNIVRGERLDEHWWYLWRDYDGTEESFR